LKRDRTYTTAFALFLFLIWGAAAVWIHAAMTGARLSPHPARWGPPFLIGGAGALLVFFLTSLIRSLRTLLKGENGRD
jgi:TRAP-type C4-dicarboxylate transport system permease small subunit